MTFYLIMGLLFYIILLIPIIKDLCVFTKHYITVYKKEGIKISIGETGRYTEKDIKIPVLDDFEVADFADIAFIIFIILTIMAALWPITTIYYAKEAYLRYVRAKYIVDNNE